jgi:hypothetical protein
LCHGLFLLGFVEAHEGFHEQFGVFEGFGIRDGFDAMAEHGLETVINMVSPFGIGYLGVHHFDEGG